MQRSLSLFFLSLALGCSVTGTSGLGSVPAGKATRKSMTGPEVKSLILTGGTILAGPAQQAIEGHAVVIEGSRIAAIVDQAEAVRLVRAGAAELSVAGMTILPGLTDAHGHLYGLGVSLDTVNLTGTRSYDEVISRVRQRVREAKAGEWITGRGWDQNDWPVQDFPTAAELDRATPDNPVWLQRVDGHAALANSAAMTAAGITASTKEPEGGRILKDQSGNPTGVFVDAATNLIISAIPEASRELKKKRILAAAENLAANGLTEIHDAGAGQETIDLIMELIDAGRFPIRVYLMLGDDSRLLADWLQRGPLIAYGGRLTVRSIKLYGDGALGSRGAALLAPYSDDPSNTGLLLSTPEHLLDVSRRAVQRGFQVNTHAIGDRGVRNVLDAFEKAGVRPADRFRIEHLQVVAPEDFPRLSRSGIIASMQPTHATSDMPWAEARLGPARIQGAYAWRTVLTSGGRLALGSDFPVEDVNPFFGIYAAVTRQDQSGWPAGGWRPDERLTLAEALRGFTSDAAFAAFEESTRGTIEPGKLADLTIVDRNPLTTPSEELFRIRPRFTIVNGAIVYDRSLPASSK